MNGDIIFRVGTRKSELALIQTGWVLEELKKEHPHLRFIIKKITTTGDQILDRALSKIGEKNLFTKELEVALANNEVDFVVHSLKDMPSMLPEGMTIGAVCRREDPRDAVVLHRKWESVKDLNDLPPGSILGTSSMRRSAQFKYLHPHLQFENIRGNLNTRLKKLDEGDMYAGLVLAVCGIERMGLAHRINVYLGEEECLYAVGQGSLAVECRKDDVAILKLLSCINDRAAALRSIAERSLLHALEGGCSVPVAVATRFEEDYLILHGAVYELDGSKQVLGHDSSRIPGQKNTSKCQGYCLSSPMDVEEIFEIQSCSTCSCTLSRGEYSGVAVSMFSSQEMAKAQMLGARVANILMEKGAKPLLDHARAQAKPS